MIDERSEFGSLQQLENGFQPLSELKMMMEKSTAIPKFSYLTLQEKPKTSAGSLQFSAAENELLSECNRNPLSKALLRMHMAGQAVTSQSHVGTERQTQLLKV